MLHTHTYIYTPWNTLTHIHTQPHRRASPFSDWRAFTHLGSGGISLICRAEDATASFLLLHSAEGTHQGPEYMSSQRTRPCLSSGICASFLGHAQPRGLPLSELRAQRTQAAALCSQEPLPLSVEVRMCMHLKQMQNNQ